MRLVRVTTTARAGAQARARAQRLAERFGLPFEPRAGGPAHLKAGQLAYVVGSEREELRSSSARLFVHRGLLAARLHAGAQHPLVVAVSAFGRPRTIWDLTAGMGIDALHLASDVLGAQVRASEASAPLAALLEEGLLRLRRDPWAPIARAARRIELRWEDAFEALREAPSGSVDVVYADPMFDRPLRAAPGFELLRAVAHRTPLDLAVLVHACRVARRAVVVRRRRGDPNRIPGALLVSTRTVRYEVVPALGRALPSAHRRGEPPCPRS